MGVDMFEWMNGRDSGGTGLWRGFGGRLVFGRGGENKRSVGEGLSWGISRDAGRTIVKCVMYMITGTATEEGMNERKRI